MNKWEYKVMAPEEGLILAYGLETWLNQRGREGWELVGFTYHTYIFVFKRELPKDVTETTQEKLTGPFISVVTGGTQRQKSPTGD